MNRDQHHRPGDVEECPRCGGDQVYVDSLPDHQGVVYLHLQRHLADDCIKHLRDKAAQLEKDMAVIVKLLIPEAAE